MLWGIDPLLTADLLYALRRMGHGDEIVLVDTNFPAASTALSTAIGEPIPLAGVNAARAVEAILSVMPLDTFVPDPACRMEIVGDPDTLPPVQREVQQAVDRAASKHVAGCCRSPMSIPGASKKSSHAASAGAMMRLGPSGTMTTSLTASPNATAFGSRTACERLDRNSDVRASIAPSPYPTGIYSLLRVMATRLRSVRFACATCVA